MSWPLTLDQHSPYVQSSVSKFSKLTPYQTPFPDGQFVAHMTPWSPDADMTCVPMRDSPGTLSAKMLDMTDYDTRMLYLMAVMDDACLQVWSNMYAEYFWYGIIAVIVLATLVNRGRLLSHTLR